MGQACQFPEGGATVVAPSGFQQFPKRRKKIIKRLDNKGLALLDCVEEVELLCLALVIKMEWIVPAEASITEAVGLTVEKGVHAPSTEIGNTVCLDKVTDFFHGIRRGNELLAAVCAFGCGRFQAWFCQSWLLLEVITHFLS